MLTVLPRYSAMAGMVPKVAQMRDLCLAKRGEEAHEEHERPEDPFLSPVAAHLAQVKAPDHLHRLLQTIFARAAAAAAEAPPAMAPAKGEAPPPAPAAEAE